MFATYHFVDRYYFMIKKNQFYKTKQMHKNYVVNKYTSIQVLQLNTYLCIKGSINMRKSIKNNNIKFIITMYSVL